MNEDVNELIRLYDEGLKIHQDFEENYSKHVPYRDGLGMPAMEYNDTNNPLGINIPVWRNPEPEPEHYQTAKTLKEAKTYIDKWIDDVVVLLGRSGKARYKLQFNDPNGRVGIRATYQVTQNEEKLGELLDDFELRLGELRKIIIDYEQSSEKVEQVNAKDIEPARYDKKKKAIIFADSVFGFRSNADTAPFLCSKIFDEPDKLWTLKELQEDWDIMCEKPDWRRVYETITRINQRIQKQTGINNLFIVDTKTIRINPAYLSSHK